MALLKSIPATHSTENRRSKVGFETGAGAAEIEGDLTPDYMKVVRIADIDLTTLVGKGHQVRVEGHGL